MRSRSSTAAPGQGSSSDGRDRGQTIRPLSDQARLASTKSLTFGGCPSKLHSRQTRTRRVYVSLAKGHCSRDCPFFIARRRTVAAVGSHEDVASRGGTYHEYM